MPAKKKLPIKPAVQKVRRRRSRPVQETSFDLFTADRMISWYVITALVFVVSLYLLLCYYLDYGIIDDAYISLRYAKNLAEGNGLVFNPGERVEGYTNFLWTVLLTLGFFLQCDGVILAIGLGVVAGCFLLVLVFFLARYHLAPHTTIYRSIAAPLCVAVQMPFLCYSVSGLENNLFAVLFMVSIYFTFAGMKKASCFNYASLALALASLTRPEATILFFFNLMFLFWYRRKGEKRISWLCLARYVAIYSCMVGSFFLWRYLYYGFWLPNSYYVKVGGGINPFIIKNGIDYVWRFSLFSYLIGVLPVLCLIRYFRKEPKYIYLISLTCVYLAAVIYEGGDHLAMFRFCVPLIPLVALFYQEIVAYSMVHMVSKRYFPPNRFLGLSCFMIVMVVAGLSSSFLFYRAPSKHKMTEYERSMLEVKLASQWANFGRWLKETTRGDEKIALITAGAIPFYSELYAIDMAGLTDTHIAHMPVELGKDYIGHEKFDNAYVLSQQPQFILAHHLVQFSRYLDERTYNRIAYFAVHRELVAMPELHRNYRYRCVKVAPNQFYCFYML